jgi:hypothetical protein
VDAGKTIKVNFATCSVLVDSVGLVVAVKKKNTGIIKGQTRLHWFYIPVQFWCNSACGLDIKRK